jgi:glycosyltransferase involved in cell wall biosynthesis
MRILHVLHQYLPEKVGGTELHTRDLAAHQAAAGHQVAIFTPAAAADRWPEPRWEDGVAVYRVPVGARDATAVFRSNFSHSDLAVAYRRVQQQTDPDLVHIQHLMGLPWSLTKAISAPLVVTLHDYWYLCANAQLITNYDQTICEGPKGWVNCARCALARAGHPHALPAIPALVPLFGYRHLRLRRVLRKARALIAPSQFTAGVYTQMGVSTDQIHVIPHGVQVPADLPVYQPDPDTLRIAYVGGVSWQKGIHVLIAAVNQLPEQSVRLDIYGDTAAFPAYVKQLRQLAAHPGIHFNGRIPHHQLWSALAHTDLLVVPTLWYETSSLIIPEAFAAGVPVLASRIGALQERLRHGQDGYYFPPGDVAALTARLQRLLQNPAELHHLRRNIQPVRTMQMQFDAIEQLYAAIV